MHKILQSIIDIDKNNKFLKYIVLRIQKDDYRGLHISQHNRYDIEYVDTIVNSIYKLSNNTYFEIPRGDYSERESGKKKYDINDFSVFKGIVDNIKKIKGRGTYNSIKKNFFVDFHRMGIIERFDKNYNPTNPYSRQVAHFAKLTENAIKLISTNNIFEKHRIFTDFINILFDNNLSNLADLIYNSDYKETQISIYEFMFVLSDINITNIEKIGLLNSYNSLKKYQKNKLIDLIKEYANPTNFVGDKTDKRDYHNWINESQQILSLMKQTSYFQVDKENSYFTLNIGNVGIYSKQVLDRSSSVKSDYFKKHSITKKEKFELHHIIPISKARNKKEVKELDNVYNLIYLDYNKHREITVNGNRHVCLYIDKLVSNFYDFFSNTIYSTNGIDSFYSKNNKLIAKMMKHNKEMLLKLYEFSELPM